MTEVNSNQQSGSPWDLWALVFAIVLPTFVTLVYFKWLSHVDPWYQQSAYGIGKTIQFGFPVLWVWLFHRNKLERKSPGVESPEVDSANTTSNSKQNLMLAIGFGLFVVATMCVAYFGFLNGTEIANSLGEEVRNKVGDLGIDSFLKYLGVVLFYSIFHSFMEEYYWRWFVYDLLKKYVAVPVANLISSLGFMAHHVILLSVYFGWDSPWTYLCSAGVAIGGAVWAWLYDRGGSLKWPWLSHLIVDAGIFGLGYVFVRSMYS